VAVNEENPDIRWYRTPLDRETLRALTERSDWRGAVQTLGYLGVLAATAAATVVSWKRFPPTATMALVLLHGTVYAFLLNGFHELVHGTVFRTRILNAAFLRLFAFLSWNSHVLFWESHKRHHQYTLHPPRDREVVLPIRHTVWTALRGAIVDPWGAYEVLRDTTLTALGRVRGEWQLTLFSVSDAAARRKLFGWARFTLAGHALIVVASALTGLWQIALLTTFSRFIGGWLQYLCNNPQHTGLMGNVPDFRLCCRPLRLNAVFRFLYWQMSYHTEHHMYAAVPCYNLGRLHRGIRHELPPIAAGLLPAWREIASILDRQKREPSYQYRAPLPGQGPDSGSAP